MSVNDVPFLLTTRRLVRGVLVHTEKGEGPSFKMSQKLCCQERVVIHAEEREEEVPIGAALLLDHVPFVHGVLGHSINLALVETAAVRKPRSS